MFNPKDRDVYFLKTIKLLEASTLVEGIIQLGSGVNGYNDEYSDIDLMIATSQLEEVESTKEFVYKSFESFNPLYMKEKKFSKDIFLIIAIMENQLELNVSIVPSELLTVRSPLWKIVVDKTGTVTRKMNIENDKFENKEEKYELGYDISFEFVYCTLSFEKEMRRKNYIYALKMLEQMREYTLIVEALNENKKLHQFKAFETLKPTFINAYLATYPSQITRECLEASANHLIDLFRNTIKENPTLSMSTEFANLLDKRAL